MASKRCEYCGRFMRLTDLMPQDDAVDEELALLHGITQEELDTLDPYESKLQKYVYVQDQWECDNCQYTIWHTEGEKYYYNPRTNDYSAKAPKAPLTEAQRAAQHNRQQERKGQLRLELE